MILQPVFSIFPCSQLPSGTRRSPGCPFPDVVFPPLPLSALSSSPFHCALQDGFGQTWWTGNMTIPLQFASLTIGRSSCGPIACWILARTSSLVTWSFERCVVFCGSTSFPWLVFFFGALLWGSMIYKHTWWSNTAFKQTNKQKQTLTHGAERLSKCDQKGTKFQVKWGNNFRISHPKIGNYSATVIRTVPILNKLPIVSPGSNGYQHCAVHGNSEMPPAMHCANRLGVHDFVRLRLKINFYPSQTFGV